MHIARVTKRLATIGIPIALLVSACVGTTPGNRVLSNKPCGSQIQICTVWSGTRLNRSNRPDHCRCVRFAIGSR